MIAWAEPSERIIVSFEMQALALFAEALNQPEQDRAAWLTQACAGDQDLLTRVSALLQAEQKAGQVKFLDEPIISVSRAPDTDQARQTPDPKQIDHYDIIERLGEGGFGVVYLAQQSSPVARKVALKVVRGDRAGHAFAKRFDDERRLLARLNHPNIAQIFAAGTSAQGDPYFTMEYVQGEPIDEYCEQHGLNIRQRIELLITLCQAVQHAHQKGVIHRDLKPSNILVNSADGCAHPHIIDFGIARATAGAEGDENEHTRSRTRGLLGSPDYMSPEQVRAGDLDLDSRADVYGLGIVLYELLAGRTPFASPGQDSDSTPVYDVLKRVVEDQPQPPSAAIADHPNALALASKRQSRSVAALQSQIQGELDWITLKAIEKDREQRYDSAATLAADLTRYLNKEPVQAAPHSRLYRARKFIQRHRVGVAASVLIVIALLAGIVGTTLGFLQAREQANNARQTVDLLQDFLSSINPSEYSRDLRVADLLTAFKPRLSEFSAQPAIQSELYLAYGNTYRSLGDFDQALGFADLAVAGSQSAFGPLAPETFEARLLRAQLRLEAGDYQLGLEELLALRDSVGDTFADDPLHYAPLAIALAQGYDMSGATGRAIEEYEAIIADLDQRLGPRHDLTLRARNRFAMALWRAGENDRAERLSREVVALRVEHFGQTHPDTLQAMSEWAVAVGEDGDYQRARDMQQQILQHRTQVLGPEHRQTLVTRLNLAWLMARLGEHQAAIELNQETLDIQRRTLGSEHPDTLATLGNLAMATLNAGELVQAETLMQEALDGRRRALGEQHPQTLVALNDLLVVYARQKKYSEAVAIGRELVATNIEIQGEKHPATLTSMNNLGWLLTATDSYEQAEQMSRAAYEGRIQVLGSEHPATLVAGFNLATVLSKLKRNQEALELGERILELRRVTLGEEHPHTQRSIAQVKELTANP